MVLFHMCADVCVVGIARTPLGSYGGSLSTVSATELGATAIKGMDGFVMNQSVCHFVVWQWQRCVAHMFDEHAVQ